MARGEEAIVDKKDKMQRLTGGKRTGRPCVHYKVRWAGARWLGHDTWEPLENLQAPRVKAMVSEYNRQAKRVSATGLHHTFAGISIHCMVPSAGCQESSPKSEIEAVAR